MSKTQKQAVRDGEVPWLRIQPCRDAWASHQEQIWDAQRRAIKETKIEV